MPHKFNFVFGWTDFEDIYTRMAREFNDCTFVEVGSFMGKSAVMMGEIIKENNRNIKLVCIDLFPTKEELKVYETIGAGQGGDIAGEAKYINDLPNSLLDTFVKNIRDNEVDDVIIPIKSDSHKCISIFQDNSLPFVFIDASHKYDIVLEDIKLWWNKVKVGGVLAGHDYYDQVHKAVHDFFDPLEIEVERYTSSWFVRKLS